MPLTLLRGILTSCSKKRQQMIYQRLFSYKMTRSAYSTSRNWKKTWGRYLNIVSQSTLSYGSLELLHNSLGWVQPPVLCLGLFWRWDSPRVQEDLACRPPMPASRLPCEAALPSQQSTARCSHGDEYWLDKKFLKWGKFFFPLLTCVEWKWKSKGQSTVTCIALFARQQPQVLILIRKYVPA